MVNLRDTPEEHLEEILNNWLDAMMEVYGDILQEWEEYDIVKPHENAKVEFKCNNCGKCCDFSSHWVWVYPSDIVEWLKQMDNPEYVHIVPLLFGILFPVMDEQDYIGYGLPSQKVLWDNFHEFARLNKDNPVIRKTLLFIIRYIQHLNPSFDKDSEYCIFYDKNRENHCIIYDLRPVQCRSYPYDYPQFTRIEIPPELRNKYGAIEDDLEDLPICPRECYTGNPKEGVKISDDEILWVLMEKANYLASTVTQEFQQEDISDVLLELFHRDILFLDREMKIKKDEKSGDVKKFVKAKRRKKKGGHRVNSNRS